jgi:hypothetical protein
MKAGIPVFVPIAMAAREAPRSGKEPMRDRVPTTTAKAPSFAAGRVRPHETRRDRPPPPTRPRGPRPVAAMPISAAARPRSTTSESFQPVRAAASPATRLEGRTSSARVGANSSAPAPAQRVATTRFGVMLPPMCLCSLAFVRCGTRVAPRERVRCAVPIGGTAQRGEGGRVARRSNPAVITRGGTFGPVCPCDDVPGRSDDFGGWAALPRGARGGAPGFATRPSDRCALVVSSFEAQQDTRRVRACQMRLAENSLFSCAELM